MKQTKPMDAERIAEIRARVEAATPGPWFADIGNFTIVDGLDDRAETIAQMVGEEDAIFIIHARQDIPDLLAELSRLRAVIEEARERIATRKFGDDGTRIWIEDYMDDLGRLLDRGLKGAEDE